MQKLVLFSDSLGKNYDLYANLLIHDWDIAIHLGDYCADMQKWKSDFPDKTFYQVRGGMEQDGRFKDSIKQSLTIEIENWKILLIHNLMHLKDENTQGIDAVLYTDQFKPEDRYIDGIRYIGTGSFTNSAFTILTINSLEINCDFTKAIPQCGSIRHHSTFLIKYLKKLPYSYFFYDYYGAGYSKAAIASKYGFQIQAVYEIFNQLFDQLQIVLRKVNGIDFTRDQIAAQVRSLANNCYLSASLPLSSVKLSKKYVLDSLYERIRDSYERRFRNEQSQKDRHIPPIG